MHEHETDIGGVPVVVRWEADGYAVGDRTGGYDVIIDDVLCCGNSVTEHLHRMTLDDLADEIHAEHLPHAHHGASRTAYRAARWQP